VDASTGNPADPPLLGSWSATRWQYTKRDEPARSVDVVCDLGGAVTLSLSAETYVLTWTLAGEGSRSEGGTSEVLDEHLRLTAEGAGHSDTVRFRVAADTLSLSAEPSAWDFDGDGRDEAADFVAVLVRL
jgi:hypothetical protein